MEDGKSLSINVSGCLLVCLCLNSFFLFTKKYNASLIFFFFGRRS